MIIFDLAQKYGRYSHYPIRAGPDVFYLFARRWALQQPPPAKVNHILKVASVCILFRRLERTVFVIQFLLHYVAGGLVDSDFLAIRAEV